MLLTRTESRYTQEVVTGCTSGGSDNDSAGSTKQASSLCRVEAIPRLLL